MNRGPWTVKVEKIPRVEFWRHGYRTGWDDHAAGRTHLLDDPPAGTGADVIPLRHPKDADLPTGVTPEGFDLFGDLLG